MNTNESKEVSDFSVIVSSLSVKFGDFYAVKKISFSVKKGEIFGFLGANGAGKTSTIRVLCGLITPTEGEVTIGGTVFKNSQSEQIIKNKVGYMSQKFTLYNDLTVEENLSFIASIRKLTKKKYIERRDLLLSFISFKKSLKSLVQDLSGGTKQQVSLAASLLHDPDIVFLDEPTAGVTPASREKFWALIKDLSSLGKTVFVTTHYMDEAEQCDRIALMNLGEIVALNSPDALKSQFFPNGIYEFYPKSDINYSTIESIKNNKEFDFFEPFGLRFHATLKNTDNINKIKKELSLKFNIKTISPTLEDVFIKAIEGGKA
jgi:ABC-2 type transport system ATP-binding protein